MFHKNVLNSLNLRSASNPAAPESTQTPSRLILVPPGGGNTPRIPDSPLVDLISVSAHRCSAFFAEAAVLVLVLALLDRFMLKGRMELGWVISALTISITLLAASIATEFSARRWLKRH
ncbi:MAG TPA: hypothetical protein VK608_07820 [Edaphobacter sp.]|nr:hypothetical protein [Edaphobacter sp.]